VKILTVRQVKTADQVLLSARCKVRRIGQDDLVFKIPAKFRDFVCADASPFAAALLLPSMKLGEDLAISGSISARLHAGMTEIVRIVSGWDVGLKPINVIADDLVPDVIAPDITAAFFSGGVDSFYTYLRHHGDPTPITHLLLAKGFDITRNNSQLWDATAHNIGLIAKEEQAAVVEIDSNVRSLLDPVLSWTYSHGGCLAAVALCLRRGIRQVYMASSADADHQALRGTHLSIDHLWSTESLTFVHDGWEATRMNKIDQQIAQSPLALRYLRVCYMNERGAYNCGKCEKCLRTMVSLYAAGVLDKAETFPSDIDPDRLASVSIEGYDDAVFHQENLAALEERGLAPDLQEALRTALAKVVYEPRPKSLERRILSRIGYLDHSYAHGAARKLASRLTGRSF
jgi:hypothetical protein